MKIVQDYKQLGLVFIQGDYINTHEGKKQEPLNRYGVGYCNDSRSNDDKFAIEFAWRNSDGAKIEYKGLIHAMLENGAIIQDFADSIYYGSSFNPIIQWRPVVLQSDDAKDNNDESFTLPIGIESPELREAFKSLKDYLKNKQAASPKEDKQMKPVYTAEMHAKGELPPLGSMVLIDAEAETGIKYIDHPTILADCGRDHPPLKVMAIFIDDKGSEIVKLQNKHSECYCFKLSSVRPIKPIIKTIKVNGFDVPAPMSEVPMIDSEYFMSSVTGELLFETYFWHADSADKRWLSRGLVHSTKSAAIAHAKAMLGIDPNA